MYLTDQTIKAAEEAVEQKHHNWPGFLRVSSRRIAPNYAIISIWLDNHTAFWKHSLKFSDYSNRYLPNRVKIAFISPVNLNEYLGY